MRYQTAFAEEYKFISVCVHCGKPMGRMDIDTIDKEPGPGGDFFRRDVFKMWIDPQHDCAYLRIEAKETEAVQR